jgi:aryl-alcohol dehydrogenase-like predicted oxidoreductase
MEYRQLGRSGIKVSTLTLGTMMFGGPTDEATAARIIDLAQEQGINSIDTADVYVKGESERVVGRSIAAQRERWVLATKFANPLQEGDVNASGASRKHIVRAVEASLKRLNTDYIDLLYIHREDHETPVEETVRAVLRIVESSRVEDRRVQPYRSGARAGCAGGESAALQHRQSPGRGGAIDRGAPLWARRDFI